MAKRKGKKQKPIICDPSNCPHILKPTDKPRPFAHLGWRFTYILFTWLILQYGISKIESSFSVSIILFGMPLIMEYIKFEPEDTIRKFVFGLAIFLSFVWVFIGFGGLIGLFDIENINNILTLVSSSENEALPKFAISISTILWLMFINVIISFFDWIMYDPPFTNYLESISNKSKSA